MKSAGLTFPNSPHYLLSIAEHVKNISYQTLTVFPCFGVWNCCLENMAGKRHFGAPDKKISWGRPQKLCSWRFINFPRSVLYQKCMPRPRIWAHLYRRLSKCHQYFQIVIFKYLLQTLSVAARSDCTAFWDAQGVDFLQTHRKIDFSVNRELYVNMMLPRISQLSRPVLYVPRWSVQTPSQTKYV